jgi:glutaminyl-tRNA synthetase
MTTGDEKRESKNFIEQAIQADLASGRFSGVFTRFPPEPNGYLHIGHAKSICLNFGLAKTYGGTCNLRFDDTNPVKEDTEYVESIMDDVRWLGFQWDSLHYASDYFDQLYLWAEQLIQQGDAYVCDLNSDEVREYRGSLTAPGRNSPFRDRTPEENLDLFRRMRAGEFADGKKSLRAKIDMDSPNINLRDPVMYRILRAHHHRTGDTWCIYPTYDWTHGQSDSLENISFSICTLEFENHRPLYDWYCQKLGIHHPRQMEFAKLQISTILLGKRNMLRLVKENYVNGWDDPRMPTIRGFRRRGYTPESIRDFCADVGVAKFNSTIDVLRLENSVRNHLNAIANRRMAVLDPIKLTITNWPKNADGTPKIEMMSAENNPEDPQAGHRNIPFSGELWIEQEDFREEAPGKFFRLKKGGAVRLRSGYIVDCTDVVKDNAGNVIEIVCTYDPQTKSGEDSSGRKVKGTIHWVNRSTAEEMTVRLYDRLFTEENPGKLDGDRTFLDVLNPDSLKTITGYGEPELANLAVGDRVQFERLGYFIKDTDSTQDRAVFNRIVTLKDTWGKMEAKGQTD